ncbi:MAG: hypothetical protein P8P30_06950 [Rickettsiales bacterium]|nr:hypothetical protein [Rickettsiales bacterium]
MASTTRQIRRFIAPRLDISFSRDDANRYLPYFIALMIFLAAFFLAGGITVGTLLEDKKQDFSEWLTVQIPADISDKKYESLERLIKKTGGVSETRLLATEDVAEMISPWFGNDTALVETLNIPKVLEVKLEDRSRFNIDELTKSLKKPFPNVQIDTHEQWLEHYLNFIRILEIGAYLLALLVVAATTVIIIFTSKTALKLHTKAIQLLHSVGAEDDYIARQFQFNAFLLGMRGGLVGVAIAAMLFFLVGLSINEINTSLLPNFPITLMHLVVWLLLPPLTGLLALFVARKTVLAMLRQMA